MRDANETAFKEIFADIEKRLSTSVVSFANINSTIDLRGVDSPLRGFVEVVRTIVSVKTVRLDKANIKTFCDAIVFIAAKGLFFCDKNIGDILMEAIFEALLYFVFELVSEVVGEVIAGICEYVSTKNFMTLLNFKLSIADTFFSEIISLDIQGYKKENL